LIMFATAVTPVMGYEVVEKDVGSEPINIDSTLTFEFEKNIDTARTIGPITVGDQSSNTVVITPSQTNQPSTARLFVLFSDGSQRRIELQVVSSNGNGDEGTGGDNSGDDNNNENDDSNSNDGNTVEPNPPTNPDNNVGDSNPEGRFREDALRIRELEDEWIQTRIDRRQTSDGVLAVYQQLDPTRGPIDPQTGLPEGKWVDVEVNEEGEPQWLFENASQMFTYMTREARTNRVNNGKVTLFATTVVVVSLVIQYVVYPRYKRRKKESDMFGGHNTNEQIPQKKGRR